MKSKCVRVGEPPTLESLYVGEDQIGEPGQGEVRVRLKATSLNYHDYCVAVGLTRKGLTQDMIPMVDGAGVVEAIGEAVTEFNIGDRVCSLFFPFWQSGPIIDTYMRCFPATPKTALQRRSV